MIARPWFRSLSLLCLVTTFLSAGAAHCQFSDPAPAAGSALSIPRAHWMQAEELNRILLTKAAKPIIVQVGARMFFAQTHIAGAIFAGPGSQAAGLQLLEAKMAGVAKDQLIVLYCGCCPWERCPNIAPAYQRLLQLGYTKVQVLYLANSFGEDWVNKGYVVEHGQ
jgi:hypothetical protein